MITPEIENKLNSATTLLDKIKVLLNDAQESEVVYNRLPGSVEVVQDIALIQSFYGTDIARIRATTQALEFNLQMTRKPSTWVFVECQKKKQDAAFQWLSQYGVKYIFVQMKSENQGIMLKNPLWNIGAENCQESRLCFVDSDVVMCNSDWIDNASNAFGKYDVISLASHQYYQADDKCKLHETIGYKWVKYGSIDKGHAGFTIGLTRKAFNEIGGLDPAIILDDIHTFRKIIGCETFKFFENWTKPFELPADRKNGYNLELGYADNIACHVWHGEAESKYEDLTNLLLAVGEKSMDGLFACPESCKLPAWKNNSSKCMALKKTIGKYYAYLKETELLEEKPIFDIVGEYRSEMRKILGKPDDKHPLFVCTVVRNGFGLTLEKFMKFRDFVEGKFIGETCQPIVVFFTDCTKYNFDEAGINVVPIEDFIEGKEWKQCVRDNLRYPSGAVVYYVPFTIKDFNSTLWVPDQPLHNVDGTVVLTWNKEEPEDDGTDAESQTDS